jgi:hypothetical protein
MDVEVFGQGLVRAGMCYSQSARVDHLRKKWRAGEKKKKKKGAAWPIQVSTRSWGPGRGQATRPRLLVTDLGSPA